MRTGMLWFDNSQSALAVKVQKAAAYYLKKYGRKPEICLVHPVLFSSGSGSPGAEEETQEVDGVTVRPNRVVLPGHLWIGIEEKP